MSGFSESDVEAVAETLWDCWGNGSGLSWDELDRDVEAKTLADFRDLARAALTTVKRLGI